MPGTYALLGKENVASIRDVQRNPSRALRGLTRVMRGSQTLGYFFTHQLFDEILEDLEALGSRELKQRVREARRGLAKSKLHTLKEAMSRYGA